MRTRTTWGDILALNCWVNLRSKISWSICILIAGWMAGTIVLPKLESGLSLGMGIALFFASFVTVSALVWLISLPIILLVVGANGLRKGTLGPKTFTIGNNALAEDDGHQITAVPWRDIRGIGTTRRHIFVRISRWKYFVLAARDFENECLFAPYYADLLRARHEAA